MFKKVIGFLTIEGWAGVQNVYWLVGAGVFVGIGMFYWFIYREYFHSPKPRNFPLISPLISPLIRKIKQIELNEWQSLAAKLAAALLLLIVLIIL